MITLAAIYAVLMSFGAIVIRVPAPGWHPEGWVPKKKPQRPRTERAMISFITSEVPP